MSRMTADFSLSRKCKSLLIKPVLNKTKCFVCAIFLCVSHGTLLTSSPQALSISSSVTSFATILLHQTISWIAMPSCFPCPLSPRVSCFFLFLHVPFFIEVYTFPSCVFFIWPYFCLLPISHASYTGISTFLITLSLPCPDKSDASSRCPSLVLPGTAQDTLASMQLKSWEEEVVFCCWSVIPSFPLSSLSQLCNLILFIGQLMKKYQLVHWVQRGSPDPAES